ncbi:MAG: fumarylacetoacetate hydrolase family protein [Gaiellaceae bacterium]
MRLATIKVDGGSAAVVLDDGAAAVIRDEQGRPAYADVGALLRDMEGHERAEQTLRGEFALDERRLLRPVLEPGAIVCVGLNYGPHIIEMGRELPAKPTYFAKLARALTDPSSEVELPAGCDRVDYEGELVVVIGAGGRDIPAEEAWAAVAGFTLMNDVSMRDFQYRTLQWFAGKSWEAATPVGPALVSVDEIGALDEHELRVSVNGEQRQRARLGDLVFDVPTLIADLSRIVTLRPGDLIATGTPGGVGDGMDPPSYLGDGDVVEVEIDGIGALSTTFRRGAC